MQCFPLREIDLEILTDFVNSSFCRKTVAHHSSCRLSTKSWRKTATTSKINWPQPVEKTPILPKNSKNSTLIMLKKTKKWALCSNSLGKCWNRKNSMCKKLAVAILFLANLLFFCVDVDRFRTAWRSCWLNFRKMRVYLQTSRSPFSWNPSSKSKKFQPFL